MIISILKILLSVNLAAILTLLYQYSVQQKSVYYNGYYQDDGSLAHVQKIDKINSQLYPILKQLAVQPDLRVYRYQDTQNCPIDLTKEQCDVETCNIFYPDHLAPIHTVDLLYLDERYTGQQGQNVWMEIYGKLERANQSEIHKHLVSLIKGIHSSISISISEQFQEGDEIKPSVDFFFWRVGNFPDRIFNLYFLQSFLIKAAKFLDLSQLTLFEESQSMITDLLQSQAINEQFDFPYFENLTQEEFQQYQKDILLLNDYMDCVHCQRCKVNGKLQIHGLELAMNVQFDNETRILEEKYDLVAYVNTFFKISQSINSIDLMFERRQDQVYVQLLLALKIYGGLLLMSISSILLRKK